MNERSAYRDRFENTAVLVTLMGNEVVGGECDMEKAKKEER